MPVLIIFLAIALIVLGPLVTIWSLNTLFHMGIPVTFWTWLATAWLSAIVYGATVKSNKD